MKREATKKPPPRIGRKDQQDPDRDARGSGERQIDREPERSDRDAGAGRPVQLDEEGRSRRGDDSPRPSDDTPVPK